MNTERYLLQYADLIKKVRRYEERIEQIENTLKGVNLDGMPHGTALGDPTRTKALNLAILREQLALAKIDAEIKRQEIADNIEKMNNPKYKELLFDRYLLLMPWEDVRRKMDEFRRGHEYELKSVMGPMKWQALKELEGVLKCIY